MFLNKGMTTSTSKMDRYTTTEYGKQNMFASEPPMQYVENYPGYWKHAEQLNGRLAMIGFFAAVHNYILTGYVIPGITAPNRMELCTSAKKPIIARRPLSCSA